MRVYIKQDAEAAFEFLGLFLSLRTPYTSLATLDLLCHTSCSSNPTKKMDSSLAYFFLVRFCIHLIILANIRVTSEIVQAGFILRLAAAVL